jgi:hypothetical protein
MQPLSFYRLRPTPWLLGVFRVSVGDLIPTADVASRPHLYGICVACKPVSPEVTFLVPRVRRGGYVFIAWKGDHSPRHVHVYRDGSFVLKWDLALGRLMAGRPSRRVVELIRELEAEGLL